MLALFGTLLAQTAPTRSEEILGGFEDAGTQAGFAVEATTADTVGGFLNGLFAVLGIVLVVLLVYGGFLYLTAAGNEQQVTKAKDVIKNSIIGLVIIVSAFAISTFVIGALTTAVT